MAVLRLALNIEAYPKNKEAKLCRGCKQPSKPERPLYVTAEPMKGEYFSCRPCVVEGKSA